MTFGHDPAVPQALRAYFLGETRLLCGHTRIDVRLSTMTQLLFAMLLVRPDEPVRRGELAFTLWPDRPEKDALANLRRHLYRLQNELSSPVGRQIRCEPKYLTWIAHRDEWIDVNEFERLGSTPDGLEAAIHIYKGDFMSQVDHDWCSAVRTRLRAAMRRNLEDVIRRRETEGDFIATLRYVEALLEQDAWREDVLCKFMGLRWRMGDRAGALASYHEFCRRIKMELGIDPMPETVRFKDRLVAEQPRSEAHFSNLGFNHVQAANRPAS